MSLYNKLSKNVQVRLAQFLFRLSAPARKDVIPQTTIGATGGGTIIEPGAFVAQFHDQLEDIITDADAVDDHDGRYLNLTGLLGSQHFIQWVLNPTVTPAEGMTYWNDTDKTLNIKTETDTVIQVGQEMLLRATNKTGGTLLNGVVVYVDGAQGNRPTIAKAKADTMATSTGTIGIVTSDIADNANGYVTVFGLVRDLDTSGEVAGDIVYLSAATAGAWTTTKPAKGNQIVELGIITTVDASVGAIFARVRMTKDIGELNDVDITSPQNGHILFYNSVSGLWENGNTVTAQINNYTALTTDGDILCDPSGGPFTVTFYTAVGNKGRKISINNVDDGANAVTLDGDGTETIQGELTQTLNPGDQASFVSDGANWWLSS